MSSKKKTWYAVLGLLSWKPMSGYDIKKYVEMGLSHFWNESYGQLYPTLDKLVTEGLAKKQHNPSGKRARHVFSITPRGRSAFQTWLGDATDLPKVRNEFLLKFFLGSRLPVEESIRLVEKYRAQQKNRCEMLEASEPILSEAARGGSLPAELSETLGPDRVPAEDRSFQMFVFLSTLKHGIQTIKSRLEWCDETLCSLNALRKAGAAPPSGESK